MRSEETEAMVRGQAQIWRYIYGAFDTMAIRCCVELRIADIINNHGCPITLSQIARGIDSPSLNMDGLSRLMRFLVHKKVFDEMPQPKDKEVVDEMAQPKSLVEVNVFGEMPQRENGDRNGECLYPLNGILVDKKIFDEMPRPRSLSNGKVFDEMSHPESKDGDGERESLYSLNHCSKWLLHDSKLTLAPLVMMRTDPLMISPLHFLSRSIEESSTSFMLRHGQELWDFASHNREFNAIFNDGMACTAKITMDAIMSSYGSKFHELKGTLVDVGGGVGVAISEIVKAYPHLKGINFDLPHVIATAPTYDGVTHVTGDMFQDIPPADSIFMKGAFGSKWEKGKRLETERKWNGKRMICFPLVSLDDWEWIMHDWSDIDCIKILKNCRKAISKETGKIIIVDIVLHPKEDDLFDDTRSVFDMVMLTHFSGGKERTEMEWKNLLMASGFHRYNIIKIPALQSIIEAFPH